MYQNKTFLAIIPARAGSKRIPGKNLQLLAGKPLLAWTVEAALQSSHIDEVLVSTDCPNISKTAEEYGAQVPFIRPTDLASDTASSAAVVLHAIDEMESKGKKFDYIVLLQPTSPLRTSENIDKGIEWMLSAGKHSTIAVTELEHPVQWANVLPDDLSMDNFVKKDNIKPSQQLEKHYRINGALYVVNTELFKKEKTFLLAENCIAFIMNRQQSVDIDEELDFLFAEFLLSGK